MEPTKEDKPKECKTHCDWPNCTLNGCVIKQDLKSEYFRLAFDMQYSHENLFNFWQYKLQERDTKISELEKDTLTIAGQRDYSAKDQEVKFKLITDLESENERLKSELDKAVTYLSKTYRYLNADSVLREEIKDFLKDKR